MQKKERIKKLEEPSWREREILQEKSRAENQQEGTSPSWKRRKNYLLGGQFRLNIGERLFRLREKINPV